MKTLESILNIGDLEDDVRRGAELPGVLKKYRWDTISADWTGPKSIKLAFDGRGYMPYASKVISELQVDKIEVYPWAIVSTTQALKDCEIIAKTRCDVRTTAPIENCRFEGPMGIMLQPKLGTLELKNVKIGSQNLRLDNIERGKFVGCDFSEVTRLTLTHVGPKIQNIIESWNIALIRGNEIVGYPYPKERPHGDLDPLKTLGLDKYFKNLTYFAVCCETYGNSGALIFNKKDKVKSGDWDVACVYEFNSGWQVHRKQDARGI